MLFPLLFPNGCSHSHRRATRTPRPLIPLVPAPITASGMSGMSGTSHASAGSGPDAPGRHWRGPAPRAHALLSNRPGQHHFNRVSAADSGAANLPGRGRPLRFDSLPVKLIRSVSGRPWPQVSGRDQNSSVEQLTAAPAMEPGRRSKALRSPREAPTPKGQKMRTRPGPHNQTGKTGGKTENIPPIWAIRAVFGGFAELVSIQPLPRGANLQKPRALRCLHSGARGE